MRDATCPAVHTALQASEKRRAVYAAAWVLGSELLDGRDDWKFCRIRSRRSRIPSCIVRAIAPDIALSTRAGPTRRATSGSAGASSRPLRTPRDSPSSHEELRAATCSRTSCSRPGVISATYISAAPAKRGAWPLGVAGVYDIDDAHLAHYARRAHARVPALSRRIRLHSREELLACVIARLIGDAKHVAVGAASPIPAASACFISRKTRRCAYPCFTSARGTL